LPVRRQVVGGTEGDEIQKKNCRLWFQLFKVAFSFVVKNYYIEIISDRFVDVNKTINIGSGAEWKKGSEID
jgi:hypothetical protein